MLSDFTKFGPRWLSFVVTENPTSHKVFLPEYVVFLTIVWQPLSKPVLELFSNFQLLSSSNFGSKT